MNDNISAVLRLYQQAVASGHVPAHAQDVLLALGKEKDRLAVAGQSSENVDTLYNSVLWLLGFGSVVCGEVRP